MPTSEFTPLVEAFLLIEQPRQRLGHWTKALAALDSSSAPPLAAVVGYYDPTSDQALLNVQYDERVLGASSLDFVVNVAILAEVGMVQPAALSEGERVRFLAERLPRCTIRITAQNTAIGALTEMVRKIKEERGARLGPPPIPASAKARTIQPRGDTADPVMLVTAKGTRDDLERLATHAALGDGPEPPAPPRHGDAHNTSRHVRPRMNRRTTAEMPAEVSERLTALSGLSDTDDDRATQPLAVDLAERLAAASRVERLPTQRATPEMERASERWRAGVEMPPIVAQQLVHRAYSPEPGTEPYLPIDAEAPGTIYARYLRGGRWIPVRVGALSLKGAALLTGALPRTKDRIELALTFGTNRALVRGIVGKVSSQREAQSTGAATFSVGFQLDDAAHTQLTALLTAARDAKITIKPPPPRATRRFPVEWPIALGTIKGAIKGIAFDVSTGGMFIKPAVPLELDLTLNFSLVLDDGSAPIAGRAKVVRQISAAEAKVCGLTSGYGLTIVDMSEADRMRWFGFLARIERRAGKRVLIGAEPSRLAELQAGLASLGYAVTGGTDPGALVQLANSERPADAVLIDAGWLQNEASASLVESLFSAKNVPCVTMDGEARRARQAIDLLLEVVV